MNITGITNIIGLAPADVIKNNIEVTNSGGLHNARVAHELRNTTYNCSVVDREGNVCGPQSFKFQFRTFRKLIMYVFFLFVFFPVSACGLKNTSAHLYISKNTCSTLFFTHTRTTYSHNRVHVPSKCARRCAGT